MVASVALTGCVGEAPPPISEENAPPADLTPSEWGARLFVDHGCVGCHTVDGSPCPGGSLASIHGEERELEGEMTVVVDRAYLADSIRYPDMLIVRGMPPHAMPSYAHLSAARVDALVSYLATLP